MYLLDSQIIPVLSKDKVLHVIKKLHICLKLLLVLRYCTVTVDCDFTSDVNAFLSQGEYMRFHILLFSGTVRGGFLLLDHSVATVVLYLLYFVRIYLKKNQIRQIIEVRAVHKCIARNKIHFPDVQSKADMCSAQVSEEVFLVWFLTGFNKDE